MPNPFIKIEDVSLEFCMYGNRAGSLKEWLLNKIVGGGKRHSDLRFHALKNFNLEVRSGARVGIVGLNGAGKSTLLKVINGIYLPQTGRLEVQGEIIPLIELGTGFDIQLTGRENIAFNWVMLGRSLSDLKRLERNIIAFAELEEFIDMPIKYYSSGMTARLAFSIATAVRPDILLIDEIFSTGDERFVEKAMTRMLELVDQANIVFLVSHNLSLIERIANRVIVMHKGEIAGDGLGERMLPFYINDIVHGEERKRELAQPRAAHG